MTEEKKVILRNSMAGKKVSALSREERELYDMEFKYKFSPSDIAAEVPPESDHARERWNLTSTMEFLSQTARL